VACGIKKGVAPFYKLAGNYRHQLLLRAADVRSMVRTCRYTKEALLEKHGRKVQIDVDVDPHFLM